MYKMLKLNRHQQATRTRSPRARDLYIWKRTDAVSIVFASTSIVCHKRTKKPLWVHPGAVYYYLKKIES